MLFRKMKCRYCEEVFFDSDTFLFEKYAIHKIIQHTDAVNSGSKI